MYSRDTSITEFNLINAHDIKILRIEDVHEEKYFYSHRHNYYEIVIITSCEGNIFSHSIDFISYKLQNRFIYFIAPYQVHAWFPKKYKKEYKGYLITFGQSSIDPHNYRLKKSIETLFNPLSKKPFLSYNGTNRQELFDIVAILQSEYNKEQSNITAMCALLEALLHYMIALQPVKDYKKDINHEKALKLQKLIDKHYKLEKQTLFYAKKMNLTAKRLNEITKLSLGRTLTQMIHDRVILEAKRELASQHKNINQISDTLGFDNASYFARFFKRYEKISPSEFISKTI